MRIKRSTLSNITASLILSLLSAIVALWLFVWLAEEMREGDTRQFDTAVRAFIHSWSSPRLTGLMELFTAIGSGLSVTITTAVTALLLRAKDRRREAIWVTLAVVGGSLIMWTLKLSFHRERPEPFFDMPLPSSYSFPSGHALLSFTLFGAIAALLNARQNNAAVRGLIWSIAAALVAAIGLSRIYLGVHYPSDVVAGYLGAFVWMLGVGIAERKSR